MNLTSNYFINSNGKLIKFDAHKVPDFVEKRTSEWMLYGNDKDYRNKYGDYLIWLYNSSAKNNAIINGKNTYIVGKGWTVNERGLNFQDKVNAASFKNNLESSKITEHISLDRIIFGGFAVQVIPNKKGDKVNFHHLDFSKIRVSKPEYDNNGELKPNRYAYTKDWNRRPEENKDFTIFEEFEWDLKTMDKNKKYIVYYKDYRPDLGAYPLPEYIGAIPYIAADYEISNFTYNNTKQGFSAGYLVNFYNGEPSEEQKARIEHKWKQSKHGGDNAGDPILSFNEDKDSGVEVTPLSANGQDDRFINLNEQIRDEIYTGHNFNPTLIGLKNSTGFNNNADELRVAEEMLQNTYVNKQQSILEEFVNSWAEINNIKGEFTILRLEPIKDQLSEQTLIQIATTDELRERAGLPPSRVESKELAEALATISPLVATKVLESMTQNEIREIVGLEAKPTVTTVTQKEFSNNLGIKDEELTTIKERVLMTSSIEDAQEQEYKFISSDKNTILGLLLNNPGISISELMDLTSLEKAQVIEILNELKEEGLTNEDNEPTTKGRDEVQQILVVYKYTLRDDAPPAKESRDFCKRMMRLSRTRSFTIEDIRQISALEGYDVFTKRGGWYNNPKTGKTTPYCRHIWKQKLVVRK